MIAEPALDQIAERLALWIEQRDLESLRDDDLRDLLAELRDTRRQHKHVVALLSACRQRYAALDTAHRELLVRQPTAVESDGDLADRERAIREAIAAEQDAVEVGEAP